MALSVVTPAAADPVSLSEAKAHCRIDFATDDTYLIALISAATQWVQNRTGRQLVTATLRQSWDHGTFDPYLLELAREPVTAVESVKYYDADEDLQTLSTDDYWTDFESTPPRIVMAYFFPFVNVWRPNALQVEFSAGYGNAAAVPQALKQAILWLVAHWYENREPVIAGEKLANVPFSVESVCRQYETRVVQ